MAQQTLEQPLSQNKCYTLNVNVADFVSNITFTIGDFVTQEPVGVATGNGDFSFDFNTGDTIEYLVMEYTTTAASIFPDMRIDLECADAACSECLELVEDLSCIRGHVVMEYYNDTNAFGLDYANTAFRPTVILRGGLQSAEFLNNDEGLYNSSNGNKRLYYVNQREQKELLIESAPPYLHKAIAIGLEHHHVFFDGTEYVKSESDYSPDYKNNSFLAPAIVNVEEKLQNGYNRRC